MKTNNHFNQLVILMIALALMALLTACTGALTTTAPTPAAILPASPEAMTVPSATSAPVQTPADSTGQTVASVTLDIRGVAQDATSQVVAAVPPSSNGPWWEAMPQYTLLKLQGYPISKHSVEPQIFVYPISELGVNEVAAKVAEDLQTLLQSQQAGESLPFLPLYNETQALHAQVNYLDFKNGQGVRFLTEYNQGMLPVNNRQLFYTFQGLTSDGRYYAAAVLPVNLSGLPADESSTDNLSADFTNDFRTYMTATVDMLNQQPASSFTPNLSMLDAMIQSLEIK